jgi:hypothetical protein
MVTNLITEENSTTYFVKKICLAHQKQPGSMTKPTCLLRWNIQKYNGKGLSVFKTSNYTTWNETLLHFTDSNLNWKDT